MRVLVVLDQEPSQDGRWNAAIPTVRGCLSWGPTLDEARANVREALAACLVAEHGLDALAMAEDAELVETDAESFAAAVEQVHAAVVAVVPQAHVPVIRELAARLLEDEESDESVVYDFFGPEQGRKIADLLVEPD
ncbi:MAG: type II toxin-antitoxin system HicB family antitoxin [Polyangiales bacterium]